MPAKKSTKTTKGKKPRISETVDVEEDRVTVVTEVVEEPAETKEEHKETPVIEEEASAHDEKEDMAESMEVPVKSDEEPSPSPDGNNGEDEGDEDKHKQVVEELFRPMDQTDMPDVTMEGKRPAPFLFWAVGVIVIALLVGGGLIYFTGAEIPIPSFTVVEPAPTETPTPVASTPTPLSKDAITIQVLNGGGVVGAASKMQTFLEDKGYTVSDVGNTDEYTYEDTEIRVKASKQEYLTVLEDDIGEEYTVGTINASLSEDDPYDVHVIVGK